MNQTLSNITEQHKTLIEAENEVYGDSEGRTITIWAAVGIVLIVGATCVLLCYRELNRRRLEADLMEELARKELIKRSVQSKLEQLARSDDSKSYMEHMELKVPFVTFGEVTKISPTPSCVELHHRNSSHHNLNDYHYHHLRTEKNGLGGNHNPVIHVSRGSRPSLFTYLKGKIWPRARTGSDSSESGSGSGSEEESEGIKMADIV